jgi:hypothetical protein
MKIRTKQAQTLHPRDREQLARIGGLFGGGGRRFYNDPPPVTDWKAPLPEDLRGHAALADVKDVAGLAKRFIDTQAMVGSSIRPPGPEADAAAHTAFREKLAKSVKGQVIYLPEDEAARAALEPGLWETLGRPKEAKGYAPAKDVELPPDALEALRAEAAEEGLTAKQFQARAARAAKALGTQAEAVKAQKAALATEFGDGLADRLKEIAVVAEATGAPQSLKDAIAGKNIDVATAKYLLGMKERLGVETNEIASQGKKSITGISVFEAQQQIDELIAKASKEADPTKRMSLMRRAGELEAIVSPDLVE